MFWHMSVYPSIHLSVVTWGGYPNRGLPHLGYPLSDLVRGYPKGGPHLEYPLSDLAREYPDGGTPPQVSPIRPGRGYPDGDTPTGGTHGSDLSDLARGSLMGVPHLTYPPLDLAGGYANGGYPTRGAPHLRYPPPELCWGYPNRGWVCHLGYSIRPGQGGTPIGVPWPGGTTPWVPPLVGPGWGYPDGRSTPPRVTDGALDT